MSRSERTKTRSPPVESTPSSAQILTVISNSNLDPIREKKNSGYTVQLPFINHNTKKSQNLEKLQGPHSKYLANPAGGEESRISVRQQEFSHKNSNRIFSNPLNNSGYDSDSLPSDEEYLVRPKINRKNKSKLDHNDYYANSE